MPPGQIQKRRHASLRKSNKQPLPTDMSNTEHRPVLIVIAGPNGSGKTTITSKILRHKWLEDAVYVNPDQVAQDRFGDWNSPEAVMQAARYCEEQRETCLKNRQSLIFETVLSSEGKPFKRYTDDIPIWAQVIIDTQ